MSSDPLHGQNGPLAMLARADRAALLNAGLTRQTVAGSDGEIVYFIGGEGPLLVLLHGAGDHAGSWAPIVSALLDHYGILAPDLAGHGESAPASGPIPFPAILDGVETVLDRAASGKSAVLVGNSLGAWIGTLVAHRHPERVSRLVLCNGGALVGSRPDLSLIPKDREEARRVLDALRCPGGPVIPDAVLDDLMVQARVGPIGRMMAAAATMFPFLMEGKLQQVRVPVELLWGECDQLMPVAYARRMLEAFPNARLTVLADCGHVAHRDKPKDFSQRLMDLLSGPAPEKEPTE